MTEKEDILIEVKNLRKYFPIRRGILYRTVGYVRAVDDVSLWIKRGKTLGLVGETGSGKTTLGRLILRLIPADAGEVRFRGNSILDLRGKKLKNIRKDMQIIFQDPYGSLNPRMKVAQIVGEGLKIFHRGTKAEIKESVKEMLKMVGLSPESTRLYPHEFSGGQRQRIGIARALALRPEFIVCDEPVSSLDVSIQAQILNLLSDLQAKMKLTYLFIAHDLSVVEHISDRVAVMYLGRLVEEASNEELYANPLHPYTRILLESIPVPEPTAPEPKGQWKEKEATGIEPPLSGCRFYPRCPRGEAFCREVEPALEEKREGHRVACHKVPVSRQKAVKD